MSSLSVNHQQSLKMPVVPDQPIQNSPTWFFPCMSLVTIYHYVSPSVSSTRLTGSSKKAGTTFCSPLYMKHPAWSLVLIHSFIHLFIYSSTEFKYLLSSYHGPDTILGMKETSYKKKRKTRFLSAFDDGRRG